MKEDCLLVECIYWGLPPRMLDINFAKNKSTNCCGLARVGDLEAQGMSRRVSQRAQQSKRRSTKVANHMDELSAARSRGSITEEEYALVSTALQQGQVVYIRKNLEEISSLTNSVRRRSTLVANHKDDLEASRIRGSITEDDYQTVASAVNSGQQVFKRSGKGEKRSSQILQLTSKVAKKHGIKRPTLSPVQE